jgi:hypothetical protein
MSLPERTLCWVEGPPHDRYCTPVEEMNAADLAAAAEALREQLPPMPEFDRDDRGPRTKIYGEVVDENRDERGHYAVIRPSELP